MSEKSKAIRLIEQLPDAASFDQIIDELVFRKAVEEGLEDARAGRVVSDEDVARKIKSWRTA